MIDDLTMILKLSLSFALNIGGIIIIFDTCKRDFIFYFLSEVYGSRMQLLGYKNSILHSHNVGISRR